MLKLTAAGHRRRIELRWQACDGAWCYEVWRGKTAEGPFTRLAGEHGITVYTDVVERDGVAWYYRVRPVYMSEDEGEGAHFGAYSAVVRGESIAEDRDAFLTGVQEAGIRYFFDYAHPVSGLAREWGRTMPPGHVRRTCAMGATGMGMVNLVVGLDRGVLPPAETRRLLRRMLRFLRDTGQRFDGAFPHWMDGATGETLPFANIGGADVVETAFLAQGLIIVREYFDGRTPADAEIRQLADELWRGICWDRFVSPENRLYWHWPIAGRERPMQITGSNEGHIAYLLAVASPTHPAPDAVYHHGWVDTHRVVDRTYYGMRLEVGRPYGFPLFWAHYSYLGFDPRGIGDRQVHDYFDHYRNAALIQWHYARENPGGFKGYGRTCWGLTASAGPDGYGAWTPRRNDHGTIAPTGALSSMPYTPEQSLAMLEDLYARRAGDLWGEFGFFDAFNDTRNWVATDFWIGIDVGPIAPMIENYRTGLCWHLFMQAPEIRAAVKRLGLRKPGVLE